MRPPSSDSPANRPCAGRGTVPYAAAATRAVVPAQSVTATARFRYWWVSNVAGAAAEPGVQRLAELFYSDGLGEVVVHPCAKAAVGVAFHGAGC